MTQIITTTEIVYAYHIYNNRAVTDKTFKCVTLFQPFIRYYVVLNPRNHVKIFPLSDYILKHLSHKQTDVTTHFLNFSLL